MGSDPACPDTASCPLAVLASELALTLAMQKMEVVVEVEREYDVNAGSGRMQKAMVRFEG